MDWIAWPARSWCRITLFLVVASLVGCAHRTPEAHPPLANPVDRDAPYRIKIGDTLDIRFYKTPELNVEVPVRSDGMVSLELVNDVRAAGLAPTELAEELTRRYANELTDPRVTVIVRGFGGQVFVQGDGIGRRRHEHARAPQQRRAHPPLERQLEGLHAGPAEAARGRGLRSGRAAPA